MKIKKSPSAFTLIELLVVISIIAILASLAIPAVTGALTRGQMVQTLNNARQLQIATQTMSLDSFTSGNGAQWTFKDGAPLGLTAFFTELTRDNYLSENDLNKLLTAPGIGPGTGGTPSAATSAFSFFQVEENNPGDQPFVVTRNWSGGALVATEKPYGNKGFVLFRKGGEGNFFTRPSEAENVIPEADTTSGAAYVSTLMQ
jgi:prepilin-type N-terminal cleavage/methylation domain-containing protein